MRVGHPPCDLAGRRRRPAPSTAVLGGANTGAAWSRNAPAHMRVEQPAFTQVLAGRNNFVPGLQYGIGSSSRFQCEFVQNACEKVLGHFEQLVMELLKVACVRRVFGQS